MSLRPVLARALAKAPSERYPTAAAFERALGEVAESAGTRRNLLPLACEHLEADPTGCGPSKKIADSGHHGLANRRMPLHDRTERGCHPLDLRLGDASSQLGDLLFLEHLPVGADHSGQPLTREWASCRAAIGCRRGVVLGRDLSQPEIEVATQSESLGGDADCATAPRQSAGDGFHRSPNHTGVHQFTGRETFGIRLPQRRDMAGDDGDQVGSG